MIPETLDAEWQARVRFAEAESARLAAEGDALAAALALSEKAQLQAAVRAYDKAVHTLGECAALAQSANAPGPRAEYLHAQGLLLARVAGREGEAAQAFKSSTASARVADDAALEVRGLQRLAELDLNRGDMAGAVARMDLALTRAAEAGLEDTRVGLLRVRAVYLQTQGRLGAALADLDAAVALSEAAAEPDEHLTLQLRLERRVLGDLVAGGPKGESFDALGAAAEAAGALDIAADVRLQAGAERVRAGAFAEGLALGEQVRRLALETNDVYRYTLACMLIAEAQERLGDFAAVLGVLLGCKITLEQQVGPEAGQAVKAILQSLEKRWPPETLQAALAEHRRRVNAAPAGHA